MRQKALIQVEVYREARVFADWVFRYGLLDTRYELLNFLCAVRGYNIEHLTPLAVRYGRAALELLGVIWEHQEQEDHTYVVFTQILTEEDVLRCITLDARRRLSPYTTLMGQGMGQGAI